MVVSWFEIAKLINLSDYVPAFGVIQWFVSFNLIGKGYAMADAIPRIKVVELQCVLLGCCELLTSILTNIDLISYYRG